jgi:hypothetical protein
MTTGCLIITNNIDPAHEDEFNTWYQSEHLDDRLGVTGFMTARRYVAVDAPQRYAAVYETVSADVLLSPTYAALLRSPSAGTRAIMPYFQDMTRAVGRAVHKRAHGAGGMAAVLFIRAPGATDDAAQRMGELAGAVRVSGLSPEALRVIVSVPDTVGVDTPESKIRTTADRKADVVIIAEWARADSADLARLRNTMEKGGCPVEQDRGGLYRLLCARQSAGAR